MFGSSGSLTFPMAYNFDHEAPPGTQNGMGKGRFWSYYTRTEKCLAVFLGIVFLLLIGLAIATTIIGVQFAELKNRAIELGILSPNSSHPYPGYNQCLQPECVMFSARLQESMNESVDPCDDFYEFACGGWIKKHPLPVSAGRWGQFDILRDEVLEQVREILEENSFDETTNESISYFPDPLLSAQQFYEVCITQEIADSVSLAEFVTYTTEVFQISNLSTDATTLGAILGILRREIDADYLFELYVGPDERNTTNTVVYLDHPQLGINRANLLDESLNGSNYRYAYRELIRQVWTIVYPQDEQEADTIAADIINLEISLASIMLSPEQDQNKSMLYNPVSLDQLDILTANPSRPERDINWKVYFEQVFKILLYNYDIPDANSTVNGTWLPPNIELFDNRTYYTFADFDNETAVQFHLNHSLHLDFSNMTFIIRDLAYFQKLDDMINKVRQVTLVDYLKWRVLRDLGPEASRRIRTLFFQFDQRTNGVLLPPPWWKECVDRANFYFGMAISYRYIDKFFDEVTLLKAKLLVSDVMATFEQILNEVEWLDPETRARALEKAKRMTSKVGYPDWLKNITALDEYYKWLDFSSPENHFFNMLDLAKWMSRKNLARILTQKQDEWITDPIIVNAFYSPIYNSINFPAAILQPPFYNLPLESLNYGAMGSVVGHEITHGFDDRGAQNDAYGNLRNWWDNATLGNYTYKAACFVDQYSSYEFPVINMTVNGNTTQSENIADNGGLRQAYRAFKRFERNYPGVRPKLLPGLSHYKSDQLFFLSYAHIMCETETPSNLVQQIQTGVHTPSRYRVNGVLGNSIEFARAWGCPLPELNSTCQLW